MSKYDIESDFEDLHGTEANEDEGDVTVDLNENKIIQAAMEDSDNDLDYENDDQKDDDLFGDIEPQLEDEGDDEGEEEEEEGEDEVDEEEDDDDAKYSKNVKKRIDRERRRANRERELREATQVRLDRIEAREDARANKDSFNEFEQETTGKLSDLRKKKAQAIEEGDTEAQMDIDDQMLDLKADLRTRKSSLDEATARLDDIKDTTDGIEVDVTKLGAKAQAWIAAHPEFNTDGKFRRAVLAADNFITTSGSNPNTKKHYEKLEGLIAKDYPDYFPKKRSSKRNKPAVTETGRKASKKFTGSRRRGKVTLTSADKENMRRFSLDPSNPEHLRQYAANKEQ